MKFTTESGSMYEIDESERRIRRLIGKVDPTPRQGPDGEWKSFVGMSKLAVGIPLVVTWEIVDGICRSTMTSMVVSLEAEEA